MDQEHKMIALHFMREVAANDDGISPLEKAYLEKAANDMGLSADSLTTILNESSPSYRVPKDEQSRMTILYYLLFLANVDSQFSEAERASVVRIGFHLGFRDSIVNRMIDIISNADKSNLDPEMLINVIRSALN